MSGRVAAMFSGLPRAELARGLGRDHVVDARRAAAQLRFREVEELDTRDGAQHGAGLRPHLLRVPEVAGVVVGDAGVDRVAGGARARPRPAPLCTSRTRALNALARVGPLRVVVEQVAVLLHRRAAARHVGDDVVDVQCRSRRRSAGGRGQRLGSSRPAWNSSAPQHCWSRGTSTSQPSAASTRTVAALTRWKNTSCTQPVSSATRRAGRRPRGVCTGRRGERVAHETGGTSDSIAASLPGSRSASARIARELPRRPGRGRRARRPRAAAACTGTARRGRRGTAGRLLALVAARSTCGAGAPRSACRTARPTDTPSRTPCSRGSGRCAARTSVQRRSRPSRRLHQVDPPARRVHLLAPQQVGRARRQAEPAVHAVVDQLAEGGRWVSKAPGTGVTSRGRSGRVRGGRRGRRRV